jgi:hypothetical protein
VRLNTEMGVVIDSSLLAGRLKDGLDTHIGRMAYELRLAEDGSLVWIEHPCRRGAAHQRTERQRRPALLRLVPVAAADRLAALTTG